jgi:hypothetical protein
MTQNRSLQTTTCGVDRIFDRAKEGAGSDERRSGWRGGLACFLG